MKLLPVFTLNAKCCHLEHDLCCKLRSQRRATLHLAFKGEAHPPLSSGRVLQNHGEGVPTWTLASKLCCCYLSWISHMACKEPHALPSWPCPLNWLDFPSCGVTLHKGWQCVPEWVEWWPPKKTHLCSSPWNLEMWPQLGKAFCRCWKWGCQVKIKLSCSRGPQIQWQDTEETQRQKNWRPHKDAGRD
jgi:hypothetical protein